LIFSKNQKKKTSVFISSVSIIIAGFFHAYLAIIFFITLFAIIIFQFKKNLNLIKIKIINILILILSALIPVIYYGYAQYSDSLNRAYINKFFQPSPNIAAYAIGFGIFTPLFIYSLFKIIKSKYYFKIDVVSICAFWAAAGIISAYIPFISFQRRLTDCILIPIIIISIFSIKEFIIKLSKKNFIMFFILAIILSIPSNILFIMEIANNLKKNDSFYYIGINDKKAMIWLETKTSPDDAVFSTVKTGNYIPAISGNTVFLGHWDFTFDYEEKIKFAHFFYLGLIPEDSIKKIFHQHNIKYIFFGGEEKKINTKFNYSNRLFIEIYSNAGTQIYKFIQ